MRRLILLPLLASAGCLYLGDLNHQPSVSVSLDAPLMFKGSPIRFILRATDREDPPYLLTLKQPMVSALDGGGAQAGCDYQIIDQSIGSYTLQFFRVGRFTVSTQVQDSQGATSEPDQTTVTIDNAPPTWQPDSKLVPATAVNFCGVFSVGQGIPIQVIDPQVSDADQDVGGQGPNCPPPETLTFTWTITPPLDSTMAVLTTWDTTASACTPMSSAAGQTLVATTANQVCLWPDYGMMAPTSYHVALAVDDGGHMPATLGLDVPVEANSLPCISGVAPAAISAVVDPANPQPFDTLAVTSVKDDLDAFPESGSLISFHWSLWRESDPVWRDIGTDDSQYMPDYSVFNVGEHIRVRVEAVDRSGTRASASCPDSDQDLCQVTSCIAASCYQWTTWDLELR